MAESIKTAKEAWLLLVDGKVLETCLGMKICIEENQLLYWDEDIEEWNSSCDISCGPWKILDTGKEGL